MNIFTEAEGCFCFRICQNQTQGLNYIPLKLWMRWSVLWSRKLKMKNI